MTATPEVHVSSPFILPSLYSMRDPYDIILRHHDCLLTFSNGKSTAHAYWNHHGSSAQPPASMPEPQMLQKLQTSLSLSESLFHSCDTLTQVFWCALVLDSNLLINITCKQLLKPIISIQSCCGSQWISLCSFPVQHEVHNCKQHTNLRY